MKFSHIPVFLHEAVDALNIRPDGVYVDCTAGGGGHSLAIAQKLSEKGRLICIDRDPDAVKTLNERLGTFPNVTIVHNNFFNIKRILEINAIAGADGILADLGVSSHQLDTPLRGFSFHSDAPLDMRMSRQGMTAAELVNTYPQKRLEQIIYAYGEEKFAASIARKIVAQRQIKPIQTTFELAELIKTAVPASYRREGGHPARKTFQAIRIEINGELDQLDKAVQAMFDCLTTNGRLAVITFHSLEDRPVKRLFAKLCTGCICPKSFPVCVCGQTPRGKLPFKAIAPNEEQLEKNPRSRSARLRVIEKLGTASNNNNNNI
ncbi:MAG: 16S rRNA (cytosine(1402)-N(4))-methyltransferase RsmH [Clostridiales bacterium]|jgi:16S rRNA (cytosine1402-N4)-methyltransferase|nr:16S rRNA (cytosine(1402)-N(4))-methyltransferase RsmH [Clostridiales bacterium]